jgi:hypothetical protein
MWFGVFMAFGTVLALVLFIQTVSSYVYVSGNLVTQEGLRTATRRLTSIERRIRVSDAGNHEDLGSILEQARLEWADRISWLRLLGPDGTVLAADGIATGRPLSFDDLRQAMIEQRPVYEMRETDEGRVLVTVSPVRLGGLDDREGSGPASALALLEIGVDVQNVADGYVYLRANLVIGVAAALALIVTLLLIKLRFPHYLRGKQLESQVELARNVQKNLLPTAQLETDLADVSAECRPASHVGGDFYDVFETDRGRLALMLGDVSGKGIAAAPLMGFIHGAAHASAWTESRFDHETATRRLNDLLFRKTAADRFISMFWASLNPATSRMGYVNAGHLPALLIRPRRGDLETVRLCDGGPVLGVVPGSNYSQGEVEVGPGDMLVVFSDGIAEAEDGSNEEFGEGRILNAVKRLWSEPTGVIRDTILREVREFAGGKTADDQTLIVLRFANVPEPRVREQESTRTAAANPRLVSA